MSATRLALLGSLMAALSPALARADDARAWLDAALRQDVEGRQPASTAFALYMRAAEAGLPEAEFDVAVMLDSGRGVDSDVAAAATWYARAAAHGERRAAYNLGQLYEAGAGVPQNSDLARAWFDASNLPAARERLATMRRDVPVSVASPPDPAFPHNGSVISLPGAEVEIVWTSRQQPEAAEYYVELRQLNGVGSREVFFGFASTSSLLAPLPEVRGHYAWRVSVLARRAGTYATSGWQSFSVGPDVDPRPGAPNLSAK